MTTKEVVTQIEAIDLFCGVGGLSYGLAQAGIAVKAGYDVDAACAVPYEHNNTARFHRKDVAQVTGSELLNIYSESSVQLLAGCAPCQPFSSYQNGRATKADPKWPLLYQFARLVRETLPDLVTMENVPNVVKHEVYDDFVGTLRGLGYWVWSETVKCQDYGLPQTRTESPRLP